MEPKISIIIPVYNAEDYIVDCLESLINQSMEEIEILCIDDVSTDKSMELISKYSKKDTRVKYVPMEKNSGSGLVRNKGIGIARGEYLSFIDSDDHVINKNVYEEIYNFAVKNNANMVSSNLLSYENGKYVTNPDCTKITEEKVIKPPEYGIPWHHQKNIYKRSFILEYNIKYPDYRRGQDPVFLAKVLKNLDVIYCLPVNLYGYRKYEKYNKITSAEIEMDYIKHFRDVLEILDAETFKETHIKYQDKMYNFLTNPLLYYSEKTVENNIKNVFGDTSPVLTVYELKRFLKERKNNGKFSSSCMHDSPETNYLYDFIIQSSIRNLNLNVDGCQLHVNIDNLVEEYYKTLYFYNSGRSVRQKLESKLSLLHIIFNRKNRNIKGTINNLKGYRSIKKNNYFDVGYYLRMYPDIRISGKDPLLHYLYIGFKEGKNPNAALDNNYYLKNNSDVVKLNISPLVHYILFGKAEKRKMSADPMIHVVDVKLINDFLGVGFGVEIKFNKPIKPETKWIEFKNTKTGEPVNIKKQFFKNRILLTSMDPLLDSVEYKVILHSDCVRDVFNNPLHYIKQIYL